MEARLEESLRQNELKLNEVCDQIRMLETQIQSQQKAQTDFHTRVESKLDKLLKTSMDKEPIDEGKFSKNRSAQQGVTGRQNHQPTSVPYAHVDLTLRSLAAQAEGFGRFAIGGLHGAVYHVTTLAGW